MDVKPIGIVVRITCLKCIQPSNKNLYDVDKYTAVYKRKSLFTSKVY